MQWLVGARFGARFGAHFCPFFNKNYQNLCGGGIHMFAFVTSWRYHKGPPRRKTDFQFFFV